MVLVLILECNKKYIWDIFTIVQIGNWQDQITAHMAVGWYSMLSQRNLQKFLNAYWYFKSNSADMKYLPGSGSHASVVSDAVVSFIAN